MRQVRLKNYEGSQIFVFQHGTLFYYIYAREDESGKVQQYMQWGDHKPAFWRRALRLFTKTDSILYADEEVYSVADAYVENAMRSIDIIIDPDAQHCPHSVKIGGKDAAVCTECGNNKSN